MYQTRRTYLGCWILLLVLMSFGNAHAKSIPSEKFISRAAENQNELPMEASPIVAIGSSAFFPLKNLTRGQDEISIDNIKAKFERKVEKDEIWWSRGKKRWKFQYDEGRSLNSIDEPIQIVLAPFGAVIVDGHHEFYLALAAGAQTIAATVTADLSNLSPLEFWKEMASRKLTMLHESPEVLAQTPPTIDSVRDNPNRYLASLLAIKVDSAINGSADAIWIKFDKKVPFIEFEIAKILQKAGISYRSKWRNHVPDNAVESARSALIEAAKSNDSEMLRSIYIPASRNETKYLLSKPEALQKIRADLALPERQCRLVFEI